MALWREYQRQYGFPADRVAATVAKAGARMCCAWGAKVSPQDLLPTFEVRRGLSAPVLEAGLIALPGAKVTKVSAEEMARLFKASRTI